MKNKVTKKELKRIEKREANKLWKKVRQECIDRDKGCIICGSKVRMSAHHLIPREIKGLKYELDNLVTLCPSHHKFSLHVSAHRNPLVFVFWLMKTEPERVERLVERLKEELLNAN